MKTAISQRSRGTAELKLLSAIAEREELRQQLINVAATSRLRGGCECRLLPARPPPWSPPRFPPGCGEAFMQQIRQ